MSNGRSLSVPHGKAAHGCAWTTGSCGLAYGLLDVVEFLRLAGPDGVDDVWVQQSALIEWRGGGPEGWVP
ncbi:hypothetical protein [Streptomyces sp. RP5T]|uniref:hypothetical protein n=1 Tax=Streptomyces sp. RP5T TaxID=2490848 RepID=UPI00289F8B23|nr:hypothetical protein [Streptomyces sp. RP5T]